MKKLVAGGVLIVAVVVAWLLWTHHAHDTEHAAASGGSAVVGARRARCAFGLFDRSVRNTPIEQRWKRSSACSEADVRKSWCSPVRSHRDRAVPQRLPNVNSPQTWTSVPCTA